MVGARPPHRPDGRGPADLSLPYLDMKCVDWPGSCGRGEKFKPVGVAVVSFRYDVNGEVGGVGTF